MMDRAHPRRPSALLMPDLLLDRVVRDQRLVDFILDSFDVSVLAHELRTLGIIKQDPKLPMDKILPPPSPWPKSIFDADEEKSKVRLSS